MNLRNKKELAAKVLGVGKERIVFLAESLEEIGESLTRKDIRELKKSGAIIIKEKSGRRKVKKRKNKRGPGKIKKKIKKRKEEYVKITRKLRKYLKNLKDKGEIEKENYWKIRKLIRNRKFNSLAQLKRYLEEQK